MYVCILSRFDCSMFLCDSYQLKNSVCGTFFHYCSSLAYCLNYFDYYLQVLSISTFIIKEEEINLDFFQVCQCWYWKENNSLELARLHSTVLSKITLYFYLNKCLGLWNHLFPVSPTVHTLSFICLHMYTSFNRFPPWISPTWLSCITSV